MIDRDPPGAADSLEIGHRRWQPVPVTQPLVLISQIQRAGGTLVSQLLDGHSELHVHPGELHIGHLRKYDWPDLDLQQPVGALFDALFERPLTEYAEFGYQKQSSAEAKVDPDYRKRVLPFLFSTTLQRNLFKDMVQARPIASQRDAIDHYITSYFNAWIDYQGLYRPPAQVKYWVAFGARLLTTRENFERFSDDYPDGRAITVVRDPVSWWASARRHSDEYADPRESAELWSRTYTVLRDNARRAPDRTLVIRFEECVSDTPVAMARIARFLGIGVEPSLLRPTFNGMDIRSDSSFGSKQGIDVTAVDRRATLDPAAVQLVSDTTAEVYAEMKALADHDSLHHDGDR